MSRGNRALIMSGLQNRVAHIYGVHVVVQFYPWFKISFLLFQTHYHVIIIHYHTQKQKKKNFEPRIKLNHNIHNDVQATNLVRSFNCFCGRFGDQEMLLAINFDGKSILKLTLGDGDENVT